MGSYCSCSGILKFNNDVVLPNNLMNNKIVESIPRFSNEKQEKKRKQN